MRFAILRGDLPMMRLDDRPANREPESDAVSLGGEERLEQTFHFVRRNPGAVVLDRDFHRPCDPRRERAPRSFWAAVSLGKRIECVDLEIEQHLLQMDPIGMHERQAFGNRA